MTIEVRCECGQRVRAEDSQAGKRYPCPKCGRAIAIPTVQREGGRSLSQPILAPPVTRQEPIKGFSNAERGYPTQSGIGQVILVYFMLWSILLLVSLAIIALAPFFNFLGVLLLIVGSLLLAGLAVRMLFAKPRVLKKGELSILFGLLRLISWNPTEGILILKNKVVRYVDDDLHDGGGIKLIYPVFGEEVAIRVPLEPQSLVFEDTEVLTREFLPLNVRGTIKWRIISVEHFYLLMSTELRKAGDKAAHQLESPAAKAHWQEPAGVRKLGLAEEWLRWTAEEQTRSVVSRLGTGLLVADQIAAALPPELKEKVGESALIPESSIPSSDGTYRVGTESLASRIYEDLSETARQYGIEIHEVTLQQVRLPAEIHAQCVEACKAAYVPMIARGEAIAQKMKLRAEADVIGAENLAAKEIASVAPAYAISDVIAKFLAKNPALGQKRLE